ncbi:MAG TPA: hypothetical protein VFN55_17695 [Solirubrobacteraceae bacterium]|nr:hypothetical protein [Solirubrobacteraceae bacterium]
MAETREPEGDDLLHRLEQRLDRASEAAERLIAEATEGAVRRPPPAGWQNPPTDAAAAAGSGVRGELDQLLEAILSLRERIPPDLQRRIAEALRELLLAVRALIDWYLDRSERRPRGSDEVQDIPIL